MTIDSQSPQARAETHGASVLHREFRKFYRDDFTAN
jgi:hypothetical protein